MECVLLNNRLCCIQQDQLLGQCVLLDIFAKTFMFRVDIVLNAGQAVEVKLTILFFNKLIQKQYKFTYDPESKAAVNHFCSIYLEVL